MKAAKSEPNLAARSQNTSIGAADGKHLRSMTSTLSALAPSRPFQRLWPAGFEEFTISVILAMVRAG
jgi:hypothetical protein